jgi:ribosomal protein L40E
MPVVFRRIEESAMPDDLVTIGTFQSLPEAEAARLRLETEGIHPFLSNAEIVNMDWFLSNAIGNIKLQVPHADAETASSVLEVMRQEKARREEEPRTRLDQETCLECGEPLPAASTTCPKCGWTYSNRGTEDTESEEAKAETENSGPSQSENVMQSLRAMRRPLLWALLLWPLIVAISLVGLALLVWLFAGD